MRKKGNKLFFFLNTQILNKVLSPPPPPLVLVLVLVLLLLKQKVSIEIGMNFKKL